MTLNIAKAKHWIFDLDNTLYPADCKLFHQVDIRMRNFIADYLDLDEEDARKLQKRYFREYGTTLSGLMKNHGMKPGAFLEYVHDIDVNVVPPNPSLEHSLSLLPGQKLVFTNGTSEHAGRVMKRLGIEHHFDFVFDIFATDFIPKPSIAGYRRLIENYAINPHKSVMVEDVAYNLEPAKSLGMTTVLITNSYEWSGGDNEDEYVDHRVDNLTSWLGKLSDSTYESES